MKKILQLLIACLFFSFSAFAYNTHDEIVKEFVRQDRSPRMDLPIPGFMSQFIIPSLSEVIPTHLQQRLRSIPSQGEPSFDGLKGKDLRFRDTPIISQLGARCSAYGLTASIENLLGAPQVAKISESHLWSLYRTYSSLSAVDAAKRMAITEYAMWPKERKYPYTGWEAKAHTALKYITSIDDNVLNAVKALDEGRPVYLGVSVTTSMQSCVDVLDPESPDTGGGHAVSISGYGIDKRVAGGGYFIIKNSWGPDCGDKGYQYMPFNYCIRRGSSYCIMWDLQGVKTAFPGVPSIEPEIPLFDMSKIKVLTTYYRPWYSIYRTVVIEIAGNSLHASQIKDVSYSVDNGAFSKPVEIDIDSLDLSFTTRSTSHDILLRFKLKSGVTVERSHRWSM
jgi:hypothetical protein